MRLVTFEQDGSVRPGVLVDDERGSGVLDLTAADPGLPSSVLLMLAAGPATLDRIRSAVASPDRPAPLALPAVRLLAPVPRPGKLICIGYNYRGHTAAGAVELPRFPDVFDKAVTAVVGPGDAIVVPRVTEQVDYEAELGVVIGRRCHDVDESEALAHVVGYTHVNDVSARDYQNRGTQWLLGKSFDTFGPMGPALVTADEVGDPQRLDLETRVNGVTTQRATTRDMIFPVAYLVSYLSRVMTLESGDVVATGTPLKVPEAAAAAGWLRPGDVVEITIGPLGTLSNHVVAAPARRTRGAQAAQGTGESS